MQPLDLISAAEYSRSRIRDHAAQRHLAAQLGSAPSVGAVAGLHHRLGRVLMLLGTRLRLGSRGVPEPAPLADPATGPSRL